MLRRFECYSFAPDTPASAREELARVLRETGRFIPEVHGSAVGHNRSGVAIDLVWEHAYDSPDAYARYMCHPYHICVLDRFLLPECPECITASRRELQLGLLGYEIEGAPFRVAHGVRRVVALRMVPGAPVEDVDAFLARVNARAGAVAGVVTSVAAPNSMGLEWFPDGWTHVWEQAFPDAGTMDAGLADEAALLDDAPVGESCALWYELEADAPTDERAPADEVAPAAGPVGEGLVVMIDAVEVAEADAARYVDAFERWYLPGARRRGLELVGCWSTPIGIGEAVTVTTVLAVGTWAAWEQARNAAVRDPAMGEWLATRRSLQRRGTRRFAVAT